MGKRVLVIILLITLGQVYLSTNGIGSFNDGHEGDAIDGFKIAGIHTNHDPINISSVDDLLTQGWPGDGTPSNPFVIDGLNISVSSNGYAIHISNVNVHILITDCIIIGDMKNETGIQLHDCSHCTINGTTFMDLWTGIYAESANQITVANSTFIENLNDISCTGGTDFVIQESAFLSSTRSVWFYGQSNSTLVNNEFWNTTSGITLLESENSTIGDSRFIGNQQGITLRLSRNVTVCHINMTETTHGDILSLYSTNVAIYQCRLTLGIKVDGNLPAYLPIRIDDVIVDSKPVLFCRNTNNTRIDSMNYSQIILVSCNNVIIEKGIFMGGLSPIQVLYSRNINISMISVNDTGDYGITIINSNRVAIDHCESFGADKGIFVRSSGDTTIANNSFSDGTVGIYLRDCIVGSVLDNEITNADTALFMMGCQNILVEGNTFSGGNTGIYGIKSTYGFYSNNTITSFSEDGIYEVEPEFGVIQYNDIVQNLGDGIRISKSYDMKINDNRICLNQGYGLYLDGGSYAIIVRNVFQQNAEGNAYSTGINCLWNSQEGGGNYWSDYNGTGNYVIPGNGQNVDAFPMALGDADVTPPQISGPAEITFYYPPAGKAENKIVYEVQDSNPMQYEIYINGRLEYYGTFRTGTFIFNFGNRTTGIYNVTIVVWDEARNSAKITTMVYVEAGPANPINYTTLIIGGISGVLFALLVIQELRGRSRERPFRPPTIQLG